MPRRSFLAALGVVGLGDPHLLKTRVLDPAEAASAFPQQDPERVQSVVGASHGNFDRVRALVSEQPALAKASWDWGFGDWETALGAASHTGRRQIAEYLIAHGARPTIFSAAMLGDLRTVEAFLAADPELHRLHGPHGISLIRHARAGGDDSLPVLDFLLDRFGPDEIPFGFEAGPAEEARYGGVYRFETDPPLRLVVGVRNDWLMVGTGEVPTSRLVQVEGHVFHPSGAPAVRFGFEVDGERAVALAVEDGPIAVRGVRSAG